MITPAPDRRQSRRYPLSIPIELAQGHGVSRDLSESGVFFETEQPMAPNAPIRFTMTLGRSDPDGRFRVECEAHVVRIERGHGRLGVAARISTYRLERRDPAEVGVNGLRPNP